METTLTKREKEKRFLRFLNKRRGQQADGAQVSKDLFTLGGIGATLEALLVEGVGNDRLREGVQEEKQGLRYRVVAAGCASLQSQGCAVCKETAHEASSRLRESDKLPFFGLIKSRAKSPTLKSAAIGQNNSFGYQKKKKPLLKRCASFQHLHTNKGVERIQRESAAPVSRQSRISANSLRSPGC